MHTHFIFFQIYIINELVIIKKLSGNRKNYDKRLIIPWIPQVHIFVEPEHGRDEFFALML